MEFEGRARIRSHLDIAPLIDIVFLLLVFFMLTSTFLVPEAIELELPESGSAHPVEAMSVTVLLDREGRLALNGEPIEREQLRPAIEALLKGGGESDITLKSDARTELQQLLEIMDEIRAAGGSSIALATVPE